jgi:hypothetical protein
MVCVLDKQKLEFIHSSVCNHDTFLSFNEAINANNKKNVTMWLYNLCLYKVLDFHSGECSNCGVLGGDIL